MINQVRIIPVLSVIDGKLVKTVNFKKPIYIGDPINAIRIFNEKEVDEIIVTDIRASKNNKEPNFKLINEMASECFIPLAYGGGIKNIEHAKKIYQLGVEKIVLNSVLKDKPELITQIAKIYGSQSVICSVDIKKNIFGKYNITFFSNTQKKKSDISQYIRQIVELGAGEIFINIIDREGTFKGYDIPLLKELTQSIKIPVIVNGGLSSIDDIKNVLYETNINAVAGSSMFVFRNNNPKSILINYPEPEIIKSIIYKKYNEEKN